VQHQLSSVLNRKHGDTLYASPDISVTEAVHKMRNRNVGSLLIMEGDRLSGIITERDVLFRVVDEGVDPAQTPVSQVMTANPMTASPSTTVEEAMQLVSEKRIRHLPLMESDKVVGLVSSGDLTRWVVDAQRGEISELRGSVTKESHKFKATIALVVAFAILIVIGIATS
jgi:CBS domain-containing protein